MAKATTTLLTGMLLVTALQVSAQDTTEAVTTHRDRWSVFIEDNPTECWVASAPKETVNTRGGAQVEVRRGDILMFVAYRPTQGVSGEISFTGGYPFAENSTVSLVIDDRSFDLISDGEWAWSEGPEADSQILAAMKAGVDAVVTGRSQRGTTTRDTFSLIGFTAATDEAARRCSS
ncbi:MAG: invasion associated locus B family protein [Pseudomonadota bacterium]